MDPDAWEAVLRVNLTGTFTVTQAAMARSRSRGQRIDWRAAAA